MDPSTGRPVSAAGLATTLRNVVVTRTFSKAFCLASVRCGYLLAHPSTIDNLLPVRPRPPRNARFINVCVLCMFECVCVCLVRLVSTGCTAVGQVDN